MQYYFPPLGGTTLTVQEDGASPVIQKKAFMFLRFLLILQDFDSWFDTNNCLGDQKLVERLHTVRVTQFNF